MWEPECLWRSRYSAARFNYAETERPERGTNFLHPPRVAGRVYDGEIFGSPRIDRWFLTQIKEIVDFEEELAATKN